MLGGLLFVLRASGWRGCCACRILRNVWGVGGTLVLTSTAPLRSHTIIISKEAMTRLTADGTPVTPGMLAKYIMSYLLNINATTNTEGMIESDIFPVNYFPIRQVRAMPSTRWGAYSLSLCCSDTVPARLTVVFFLFASMVRHCRTSTCLLW